MSDIALAYESRDEVVAMLQSMMGTSHAWQGVDALEYQRQLRGEYRKNV